MAATAAAQCILLLPATVLLPTTAADAGDAAGNDVKDIGTIAKEAGDEMAAATKSPEAEPVSQTAKKAKS